MELVAFVTIIFAFVASSQIRATCTKHHGTKLSNNIGMDSCPKDYYGNVQINLEMDSYEMSKRLQIAQYQLDSFLPYKDYQFLSGAYALEPEHDAACKEKPIYIYVPYEQASLRNAIDWNDGLKVLETYDIDNDDRCFISPKEPQSSTTNIDDHSLFKSDFQTTKVLSTTTTSEPTTTSSTSTSQSTTTESTTTESTTSESTTTEQEDLSLCGEKLEEQKSKENDRSDENIMDKNFVPEISNKTIDNSNPLLDNDENDEVQKRPSRKIKVDETKNQEDSNNDHNKNTTPGDNSEGNCDVVTESIETSQSPNDGNDEVKKVQLFKDKSGNLFDIVVAPEDIDLNDAPTRQYRIDKNGNLIDILTNNQIEVRFEDDNNTEDPKRKKGIRRDLNGNIINIVTDGNLERIDTSLVDDVKNLIKKVYKIDQKNNLVDIQILEDFIRETQSKSEEFITKRPPNKFYVDVFANRIELIQSDIFFLPDYSWSSEDIGIDKPRRKYRLDKSGTLIDVITNEQAGVNWDFIDENKLKPILDSRGNIIIVVLNNQSFDSNDLVKSKNRRILRLDMNFILIGYYSTSTKDKSRNKQTKKPTKKPSVKPPKDYDYSAIQIPSSKEKMVTEQTHPDMFKDTDCLSTTKIAPSEDYRESSDYSDESEQPILNTVESKIPSEMFLDTNCSSD